MSKLLTSISLLLILFSVSCSKNSENRVDKSDTSTVTKNKVTSTSTGKLTILFFMNPMGSPCQMQDQVIINMGTQLTDKADISYIKTTEMKTARPMFQKYGIRALPSLIILNSDGSLRHRFSPGIISPDDISKIIN